MNVRKSEGRRLLLRSRSNLRRSRTSQRFLFPPGRYTPRTIDRIPYKGCFTERATDMDGKAPQLAYNARSPRCALGDSYKRAIVSEAKPEATRAALRGYPPPLTGPSRGNGAC